MGQRHDSCSAFDAVPRFTNDEQHAGKDIMDDTTDLSSIDSNDGYGWPDPVTRPERTDATMHVALQRVLALTRSAWHRPQEAKPSALLTSANDDRHAPAGVAGSTRAVRRHQRAVAGLRMKF